MLVLNKGGLFNMKTCPFCGAELKDYETSCYRCGRDLSEAPKATSTNQVYVGTPDSGAPTEAFDSLYARDARFRGLYKLYKKRCLISLLNGLSFVVLFFAMFLPFFVLNGNKVGDPSLISSYPQQYNIFGLFGLDSLARSSKLDTNWYFAPEEISVTLTSVTLPILIAAGAIALISVLVCIPTKKGCVRAYNVNTKKGNALTNNVRSFYSFIPGAIAALFSFVTIIIMSATMSGVTYTYDQHTKPYALGEMSANSSAFTLAIVFSIIILLVIIAGQILLNLFLIRPKLEELEK